MVWNRGAFGAIAILVFVAGCTAPPPNPRLALRYEKGWQKTDLARLAERAGTGDVEVVHLGNTAWVSHHAVIVRTEEVPHYHRFHDLTMTVLRGEGILNVEGKRVGMKAGDVAHVHRGTSHFFRNTGKEPAAAFVIFSPPFDGRDTVVAEEETSKPAGESGEKGKKRWWLF